jgi:AcrR family transcriptional regulator
LKVADLRKQELINTAKALFFEKGFDKTSVSEIVKACGVAQGTFYYYFKTKEEIFFEVINDMASDTLDKISEDIYIDMPIEEKINLFIKKMLSARPIDDKWVKIFKSGICHKAQKEMFEKMVVNLYDILVEMIFSSNDIEILKKDKLKLRIKIFVRTVFALFHDYEFKANYSKTEQAEFLIQYSKDILFE